MDCDGDVDAKDYEDFFNIWIDEFGNRDCECIDANYYCICGLGN